MSDNLNKVVEGQVMQAICVDLPNEAEEHYWSWVNSPKSYPSQYRHCMICNRIDATEAIDNEKIKAVEEYKNATND